MTPAKLIRAAREHLGMTQREFATLIGRHPITICKWETGAWIPADYDLALAQAMAGSKVKAATQIMHRRGVVYCLGRVLVG